MSQRGHYTWLGNAPVFYLGMEVDLHWLHVNAEVRGCVGHVQRLVLKRAWIKFAECSAVALFELSDSVFAEPMSPVRPEPVLFLQAWSLEETENQAAGF